MARKSTKLPKPVIPRNAAGFPYPLSEAFMCNLAGAIGNRMEREQHQLQARFYLTTQQVIDMFIKEEDRAMCRSAPNLLLHAYPTRKFETVVHPVHGGNALHLEVKHYYDEDNERERVVMPCYVTRGPLLNDDGYMFRLRSVEVASITTEINRRWKEVYAFISTLNCICRSVADILANFPALQALADTSYSLRNYIDNNLGTVGRVTRMPPELRAAYKDVTRSVTRVMLDDASAGLSLPKGMWYVIPEDKSEHPDWLVKCQGFIGKL